MSELDKRMVSSSCSDFPPTPLFIAHFAYDHVNNSYGTIQMTWLVVCSENERQETYKALPYFDPNKDYCPPFLKPEDGFSATLESLKSELYKLREAVEGHDTPELGAESTVGGSPRKIEELAVKLQGMSWGVTAHLIGVNKLLPGKAACGGLEDIYTEMLQSIKKWAESTDLSKSAGSPRSSRPVPSRTRASDSDAEIRSSYKAWIRSCESLQRCWEEDLKVLEKTRKKEAEHTSDLDGFTLCGTSPEESTDSGVASQAYDE